MRDMLRRIGATLRRNLPEGSRHCAILAVITLYRAIAEYLIQP